MQKHAIGKTSQQNCELRNHNFYFLRLFPGFPHRKSTSDLSERSYGTKNKTNDWRILPYYFNTEHNTYHVLWCVHVVRYTPCAHVPYTRYKYVQTRIHPALSYIILFIQYTQVMHYRFPFFPHTHHVAHTAAHEFIQNRCEVSGISVHTNKIAPCI